MDEWIRKMWSTYTMEYYASIRQDEYPTFVSTWTGLEEIMLSEISQAESHLLYGFTYLWSIRKNTEDIRRRKGEVNWGKKEREMNHERLWILRNKLRVLEGRGGEWASLAVGSGACIAWSTGCGA